MIWPTDGFKLAVTKIKTRRIRLGITLFISSLLFVALSGILFTVRGVVGSIEDYNKEGLGARYIASAYPVGTEAYSLLSNPDIIARAKVLEKEYLAKRKTEAKRLGIEYDPLTEIVLITPMDGPSGKVDTLNPSHIVGRQAIEEYYKANPRPGVAQLEALATDYGFVRSYESAGMYFSEMQPSLRVIFDDKESFAPSEQQQNYDQADWLSLENFYNSWQSFSGELLQPFMLADQTLIRGDDGAIPILAPYSSLESVLGLDSLPSSAKAKEKLERLKEVRAKAAGYSFEVCYRNTTSMSRVNTAINQQEELTRNKTNKDYVKPELIYDLPVSKCGDVVVARDVRSAETKKQEAKQEEFRRLFGEAVPQTNLIKFKIVGIVPDAGGGSASNAQQIIQTLLTSSVGSGWFTPKEVVDSDQLLRGIFNLDSYESSTQYYVELDSAEHGRQFIDSKNCNPDFSVFESSGPATISASDPFLKCVNEGKPFSLSAFGSNSLAIDEFKKGFEKFFKVFMIIVMSIASLIMMGIVARIIADSRRETAVFRAIGAKRMDIAQIYLTYVAILCVLIGFIAMLGGIGIGKYLQSRYATDMRIETSIAFNTTDSSRDFSFSKVTPSDLLTIWGVIFAVGGISSLLPLLSNLRRNPIKDMRDER